MKLTASQSPGAQVLKSPSYVPSWHALGQFYLHHLMIMILYLSKRLYTITYQTAAMSEYHI